MSSKIPTSYREAKAFLGNRNSRNIKGKRSTCVEYSGENIEIVYHRTAVVTFRPNEDMILNDGGWRSVTTKARINDALKGYAYLYQKNFTWYLSECDGARVRPFVNGTIINKLQAFK
jgi:hypothetical protein